MSRNSTDFLALESYPSFAVLQQPVNLDYNFPLEQQMYPRMKVLDFGGHCEL